MINNSYTRGFGLLEGFLTKLRANKANSFIAKKHKRGRVLDIGCGSRPYFLSKSTFKERYGIDPSINIDKVNDRDINLLKLDAGQGKLPFKDDFFDAVTMLAVFEHIDNDKLSGVLKEIKRVLKKDGLFIITTPAPWADKLLHFMARLSLISAEEIHEHKHNHQKAKIEDIINQAGFKRNRIKSGFFELHMNMWFTGVK